MEYTESKRILDSIEGLHQAIRTAARESIRKQSKGLATILNSGKGDVSYGIDVVCERMIDKWFAENPPEGGAVVVCEGPGTRIYPGRQGRAAREMAHTY